MTDSYLTISTIAADEFMVRRVTACVTQQAESGWAFPGPSGQVVDASSWAVSSAYRWAASPTWAEKWDYAVASNIAEPGKDSAVITDADILATVQHLGTPPAEPAG
jgi:hypothetical protein